jgi:hypothetical protein
VKVTTVPAVGDVEEAERDVVVGLLFTVKVTGLEVLGWKIV